MNPPYRSARPFIEKALLETKTGGVVCCLTSISFLASQERFDLFNRAEIERVIVLSKRPSMPDGDALLAGKVKRGGGQANFVWLIFRSGGRRGAKAVIDWWMPANDGGQAAEADVEDIDVEDAIETEVEMAP